VTCIFCRIVAGEVPAREVARSDHAMAFHDVNPQAPVHVLVVPLEHAATAAEAVASPNGAAVVADLMQLAVRVAGELGLEAGGYRFVVNTGADGGQTVGHLHLHVLGGRAMHWPPG
jgi:histidine triad (HIT) family protein